MVNKRGAAMLYSDVLQSLQQQNGVWTAAVPEDWLQGRSVFGGLQAAFALKAMRALAPAGMPLRTLQVTFIAPVLAGGVSVQARLLRTGKNAVHAEARLMDDEQVLCSVIGVFGARRESTVTVTPQQPVVEVQKSIEFRHIPGVTPTFTQHFSARWLRGGIPFSNSSSTEAVIEIGMHDSGGASEAHVLALADFIPPVALAMLKTPAPGSSLTWMMEFLTDRFEQLPLTGWRVDAQLVAARDGYTNQSVMLWGPGGVPVALSCQSMVVFG